MNNLTVRACGCRRLCRQLARGFCLCAGSHHGTSVGRVVAQSPHADGTTAVAPAQAGATHPVSARRTGWGLCDHAVRHTLRKQASCGRDGDVSTREEGRVESRRILPQVIRLNVYRGTLHARLLPQTHPLFRAVFHIPNRMHKVLVPQYCCMARVSCSSLPSCSPRHRQHTPRVRT